MLNKLLFITTLSIAFLILVISVKPFVRKSEIKGLELTVPLSLVSFVIIYSQTKSIGLVGLFIAVLSTLLLFIVINTIQNEELEENQK